MKDMIKNFDDLTAMLLKNEVKKKIAVVAAQDEHTLEAVVRAYKDGLIAPILIGEKAQIIEILESLHCDFSKIEIIAIEDPIDCAKKACELARAGKIDAIMKGKIETGVLMKTLLNREQGIRKKEVLSLLAFMESPHYHKIFAITDVGLLTYPNKEQKLGALKNAVEAFHKLGIEEPKVAMLAAVEKRNEKMPETVDAAEIKEEGIPGAILEGPISYDLALDKEAARIKNYESPVAGDADILLVPDIVSGNIAAKSITVLGGGRTGGTVLGAMVPVMLVSRAATADDKYMSIVVSALTSGKGE